MFELEDFAQGNVHGLQVHKLSHFSVFGHITHAIVFHPPEITLL
jgi:hypothetical protein